MSKFIKTQELLELLNAEFDKFNKGEFQIEDFETLLEHSRELHERMLILRYKAFEKFKIGENVSNISAEQSEQHLESSSDSIPTNEIQIADAEVKPESKLDNDELDMDAGFDFALFDDIPMQSNIQSEEESESEIQSHEGSEVESEIKSEREAQEEPKPNVEASVEKQAGSFLDQVRQSSLHDQFSGSSSNRLGDQLNSSKIASISGALNLNDRIRFTKNLFGGNAETFNQVVQSLDGLANFSEAQNILNSNANDFSWDHESEVTIAFIKLVERRYA